MHLVGIASSRRSQPSRSTPSHVRRSETGRRPPGCISLTLVPVFSLCTYCNKYQKVATPCWRRGGSRTTAWEYPKTPQKRLSYKYCLLSYLGGVLLNHGATHIFDIFGGCTVCTDIPLIYILYMNTVQHWWHTEYSSRVNTYGYKTIGLTLGLTMLMCLLYTVIQYRTV